MRRKPCMNSPTAAKKVVEVGYVHTDQEKGGMSKA